ncbi:hypothetical protein, partial [Leptospira santarosai]|uniref:hypothetical protein n=1 Tax=Leptospira santarosai TaxID=28183 RepID=UPI001C400A9B
ETINNEFPLRLRGSRLLAISLPMGRSINMKILPKRTTLNRRFELLVGVKGNPAPLQNLSGVSLDISR